jgi:hypothetical protein
MLGNRGEASVLGSEHRKRLSWVISDSFPLVVFGVARPLPSSSLRGSLHVHQITTAESGAAIGDNDPAPGSEEHPRLGIRDVDRYRGR